MEKDYFDELVIECESDWRTFRKGRYASIWQGIVEKYSDQAHFVYELLQNADDAKATYARFKLYHNRLVFAHNGSKHFSVTNPLTEDEDRNNGCLGDVNAITSIGHSTKIEQNTIGKFGIGFKAVFQYTKAPHIYDQNIRFKIERYIVPSRLEHDHAERKPEETLFEFPFDHNINTAEIAFNAISQRLISLVNPLLFLSHLQEIRFEFDDTIGSYTKEIVKSYTFDDTTVEKIILKQTINKETKKIQLWLFSRTDENSGRYAVGFYMNDKGDLIPANDFAYCFFPTTVNTGLHFIIHLCSNIEFIFGPPGTGKTTYLANEVIIPMMMQNDRCRVLVLTPTNKAADVIAEKIMEMMGDDTSYKEWLVRFGTTNAPTIVDSGILRDKTFDLRSLSSIVTVTTIDRYPYDYWMTDDSRHYLRNQNYDYIIFDEASMIPLFKMIYPLYHREPKKFIIAGDPFQIEPVIRLNMWEGENIYKMVRLNSFSSPKTRPHPYDVKLLTTQYRSIPLIGELFSKMTYDGILKHHRKQEEQVTIDFEDLTDVRPLNLIKFPVSKYESVYRAKRLGTSPYQIYSALFAYEFTSWIQNMISSHNPDKKVRIGVIAAYKAQADLIQRLIATNPKSDIVEIQADTIHGFQGDECEIIIAVYNPPPGMSDSDKNFLNKKNIVNVSISRARDYLFILMPDDNTEKVDNLRLIKQMEQYIKDTDQYTEYSSRTIEQMMFGKPDYLEENSFSTAHQNVNVYGLPEQIYEIRSEESAIDIQIKK